jgi:tetratricopeptide (TPR) repeat protein
MGGFQKTDARLNIRAFACAACTALMLCAACDTAPLSENDLDAARAAGQRHDWPQAERLLERYLHGEESPERRWEAWMALVDIRNRIYPDQGGALGYLETMLQEFSHDVEKKKIVLTSLGKLHETLGHTAQALAVWMRLAELDNLTDREAADAQRRIGNLHFQQRRFDLAEEALQTCRALPVDESLRAWCLYDLALANTARDELGEAREQATRVLGMQVDDQLRGLAGFLLADVLEQLGLRAEALSRFESVRSLYPNEMVVDNRIAYLKKRLKERPGSGRP